MYSPMPGPKGMLETMLKALSLRANQAAPARAEPLPSLSEKTRLNAVALLILISTQLSANLAVAHSVNRASPLSSLVGSGCLVSLAAGRSGLLRPRGRA